MKIVVVGGRGLAGREVVNRLRAQGHAVVSASRASGVDLMTGQGLPEVLADTEVVVDVSNSPTLDDVAAFTFFKTAAVNLLEAEVAAGIRHHIALSVVGTGRLGDSHYFRGKALQEQMIRASGIAFTIVHATQFFEFLVGIIEASVREQTVRLSPAYIQPVASADVAATIAGLVVGPPVNGTIEIAGPERERLSEIIRRFITDIEGPCDVVADARAPYFGAVLEDDSLLPLQSARIGTVGFKDWFDRSEFYRADW
jgi:uncharacterized protein YbjT (DUF2867 family)